MKVWVLAGLVTAVSIPAAYAFDVETPQPSVEHQVNVRQADPQQAAPQRPAKRDEPMQVDARERATRDAHARKQHPPTEQARIPDALLMGDDGTL